MLSPATPSHSRHFLHHFSPNSFSSKKVSTVLQLGEYNTYSLVQVFRFDMSSVYSDRNIVPEMAGTILPDWFYVYPTQNFMAFMSSAMSGNSSIIGYDISGITTAAPRLFSSGQIQGAVMMYDQFSADLYEGHLRIVTTEYSWTENSSNWTVRLSVMNVPDLSCTGAEMLVTGETSFVTTDYVASVRFMGDYGYIEMLHGAVHVYDMSNPSDPKKVSELDMAGYSTYLEPIKVDGVPHMLDIGESFNEMLGEGVGSRISLVDISDPIYPPSKNCNFVGEGRRSLQW
jgi:hypothetical protein